MYFQIGLLVLIGLGAKNAVLRVTAAVELRKQGKSIMEATIEAGEQRLRPIIMTSLAFAFGVLPLAIAVGAGANARHSIGTGILGGMLGETTLAMLYVPLFFYIFDRLNERSAAKKEKQRAARARCRRRRRRARRTRRGRATDAQRAIGAPTAIALRRRARRLHGRPRLPAAGGADAGRLPLRAEVGRADRRDTEWWKQFGDPVLDNYIVEALAHNKNIEVAVANVEQAAGVLTTTRSPLFPQLGYQGDGARQRTNPFAGTRAAGIGSQEFTSYSVIATASWEIDLWGRIRRLTESARASLLATDEARRGVVLSLVASTASTYLQLLGLDEQLATAKRTLGAYGETVKLFELQFKYGQVSRMNVEQARSQYETAAAQIPVIENQIAQTETALSILLGRNPGPIKRGKALSALALPAVPAGLPSQLLERRPDLMQAEQTLDRRQRADRRREGAVLPDHLAHRRVRRGEHPAQRSLPGIVARLELRRLDPRPDLHRRGDLRAGRAGRGRAEGGARLLPARDPERVRQRGERARREPEARRAARGPEPAGQGALRVREARAAAVRRRLHVLHDRAAGRAAALPGRAEPGHHPRAALRVVRRHLPGARRRLGRQGGRALAAADRRHPVPRRREGGGAGAMRSCTWAP